MNLLGLPRAALVACALLLVAPPIVAEGWDLIFFILTKALFIYMAVLGVAMFLRAGMVTFGHALFYATGAYVVGFSARWFDFQEALVLVPLGALAGVIMAALVGLIMARYRGVFFAMLNLAFSMILYGALLKFYWFTGGTDGLAAGPATLLGTPLLGDSWQFYYFTLAVAGIVTYVVYRFLASPVGYFLRALGDNEIRIEYSGESVRRVVYLTYVLSGGLGGVAGVFAAFTIGHIVPEDAFWIQSGEFVFVALLGGFESVAGSLMGAVAYELINFYAAKHFPWAWQMVLGGIMLLIILFRPGGLWAIYELVAHRFGRRAEAATSA